ncbi:endonuclease NucS domain-containing protein [Ochrobactrum teleogrylli]|uniref:endonuclease NucS domain-containing protein n=1 Tax=Ochrobactrum teleogrylli TaxID=2479765 RepID=UPI00384F3542
MLEAPLRDLLSAQISILEDGLQLLEIEKYLPSTVGTRSFIDILAKDQRGRWVLIELKRSDAAAREAIHEIHKYVEAVKSHLGARDDEIRALIVSTEWKELLVPFSRFAHDTLISVLGIHLTVDKASGSLSAENVEILGFSSGRVLSAWHEISMYSSHDRLLEGIASYDASCNAKGIKDYIMLEMVATDDFYERSVWALAHNLNLIHEKPNPPTEEDLQYTRDKLERLEHLIYFVPQLQSAEDYLEMISSSPEMYEEAKGFFDDMEGDELLQSLQSYAFDTEPRVKRDHFEIGYPAKFNNKLLEVEKWSISRVHRRGAFARNTVLTDETILSEVGGDAGTSGQKLKRSVMLSDRAEMAQLFKDLEEALPNNSVWTAMIRSQLEEAKQDFPDSSVDVSVFAPSTGILTLFFATTKDDGVLYVPSYSLNIHKDGVGSRVYVGELTSADAEVRLPAEFKKIIDQYYDGDIGSLTLSMTWGGYEPRDIDILEELGIIYSSIRCDITGEDRKFSRVINNRWKTVSQFTPFALFNEYLERNCDLLSTIFYKLSPRIGVMCDGSSAAKVLEDLVDENCVAKGKYYVDGPDHCDLCLIPLQNEEYISDGRVDGHAAWANMCADCTVHHGAGIAWGTGQLYRRTPDNRWLMVAGGAPDEEEDEEI